jgi:uncharacterized protein
VDAGSPPRTDHTVHGPSGTPPTQLPPDPFGGARRVPAQAVPAIEVPEAPPSPPTPPREHFAPDIASKLRSYVYLLVDPRTGRPFFVGKGRGDRCFDHVAAARSGRPAGDEDADGGPFPVLDRIREAESDGREVRIEILRHGLSPREARLVEAAVADALGIEGRAKLGGRRRAAGDMDVALAKRAKFKRFHQVVLLRVGGTGADASYEIARHSWRIGQRWIDPSAPRSPRWAVLVVGELVAAVFRIDHWEPTGSSVTGRGEFRYSFVGVRDEELERRYLGRSVAALRGAGRESPVTYVWCGPNWVNTAG